MKELLRKYLVKFKKINKYCQRNHNQILKPSKSLWLKISSKTHAHSIINHRIIDYLKGENNNKTIKRL